MKKILIFSLYDNLAATNRHRFKQFEEKFNENNIQIYIQPLLNNNYLEKKFLNKKISFFYILFLYLRRFYTLFFQFRYDFIIIHCELFPFVPYYIEKLLIYKKYIYDFDDAVFFRYDKFNFFFKYLYKNKFKHIIRKASLVHAGSQYLLEYSLRINTNSFLLPTSVDTNRYKKINISKNNVFTIGWIGSPSSEKYLDFLIEPFDELSKSVNFVFLIIGANTKPNFNSCNCNIVKWNYSNEIDLINQFDIGIMPLEETDWEKGKCAFKLIQCMSCEIPVVASPIGFNNILIDENVDGLFAKNKTEWIKTIKYLFQEKQIRLNMGNAARKKIIEFYSKEIIFDKLINNIRKTKLI